MNYFIVNFEDIPSGRSFIYQREDLTDTVKCKKLGRYGFSYKQGVWTIKRYSPFPRETWYCCVSTRTYNDMMR